MAANDESSPNVTVTLTVSKRPPGGGLPTLTAASSGAKMNPKNDPSGKGVAMNVKGQIIFRLVNNDTTTPWMFQEWVGIQANHPNLFGITFTKWNSDINAAWRPSSNTVFIVDQHLAANLNTTTQYVVNLFNGDPTNPQYLLLKDPTIKDQTTQ